MAKFVAQIFAKITLESPLFVHILPSIAFPPAVLALFDGFALVADFGFAVFKGKGAIELWLDDKGIGLGIGITDFAVFNHPNQSFRGVVGTIVEDKNIIEHCFFMVHDHPFPIWVLFHG